MQTLKNNEQIITTRAEVESGAGHLASEDDTSLERYSYHKRSYLGRQKKSKDLENTQADVCSFARQIVFGIIIELMRKIISLTLILADRNKIDSLLRGN